MQRRPVRLAMATAFCFGMFGLAGLRTWPHHAIEWMIALAPVVAGLLLWVPRLEPQVLSRAILWGYLFWAFLGSLLVRSVEPERLLLSVGLGAAGALAMLPRDGLTHPPIRGEFAPVAFRGVLVVIMVMALTDALVLGASLLMYSTNAGMPKASMMTFLGVGSAAMFIAVGGLLRMKSWAFALNLVANLGVATLAWCVDEMPAAMAAGLTATAVLQLLVAAPLARRIAKPGSGDPSAWLGRLTPWAIGATTAALVASRIYRHF
ncbi:MAG: hypothetical protein AB8I08_34720 [Sandaracinaceae bacterium]